ncbi:hypothetical protein O3M35_007721 [Rhynocoris fuscipes]|uniref:Uncharacterized protein n=1 Tax=Rhynocoris fuscipes TaxID=488301 RepID=A0AAW1DCX7_9HEMI
MRINAQFNNAEILERRKAENERKLRDDKLFQVRLGFIQNTDLKGHYYKLNHDVDLAMQAVDADLEKKRNQLKAKLLEEETCLTYEYVDKAQKYAERLFQEKKRKAEEIIAAHEKDRQDYVNEMINKHRIINSEEFREKASLVRRKLISKAHLLQIKEKQLLKEKEKELDKMYDRLMAVDCNYNNDTSIIDKFIKTAEQGNYLRRQIAGHEYAKAELEALKVEEKEVIKRYNERLAEEDRLKAEKVLMDKEDLRNMLLEQIRLYHELKDKRDSYDREIDKIIIDTLMKETAENIQTGLENKMLIAKELGMYKKAWEELNEFKKNLNDYDEMAINSINQEKVNDMKHFNAQVSRDNRKLAKVQTSYWDKQIKQKEDDKNMTKQIDEAERKFYEICSTDIDNARKLQTIDDAKKIQNDLFEQMKYNKLVKKREDEDLKNLEKSVVDGYKKRIREFQQINSGIQPTYHPFYKTLVRCRMNSLIENAPYALWIHD